MPIARETLRRLPRYLTALESLNGKGPKHISSSALAELTNENSIKIRHDLNHFGHFGQKGVGYDVDALRHNLRHILGLDRGYSAVLLGGNGLESVLLDCLSFAVCIDAVYPLRMENGKALNSRTIQTISEASGFVRRNHTDIAILAVPDCLAQTCAESLEQAGIRGLLNLTGTELVTGSHIIVENIDLPCRLLTFSCRLNTAVYQECRAAGVSRLSPSTENP